MKKCTWCGKELPDELEACPFDQRALEVITPRAADDLLTVHPVKSNAVARHIFFPLGLWLTLGLMLFAFFGRGAWFLFGLATALGAALDCRRFQDRGSRILGIAFKPVVVFAVCGLFFWGFGFVWYLLMRHKVVTSPLPNSADSADVATNRPQQG